MMTIPLRLASLLSDGTLIRRGSKCKPRLMMDFTSTQARAKGVAPTTSCEESHTEAVAARPLKASPPPTVDGVDKMYCQLAEIHALAATQLVECIHWHRSNSTSNVAHTGVDW
jgi:hypothetical protein